MLSFFLILIMLFPVTVKAQDTPKSNKPLGGTLIWGVCTKPTIINPILTTHSVSAALQEIIFNGLVRINSKGEIEPDLAESWDISNDGLIYTFYLRKGVRFHDGRECTAYDVKFTYDKLIDPGINSPFRSSFELVKDFKVIDKFTFQLTLKKSSASFIYRLVREIVPRHLFKKADFKNSSFNFHPIGTGPFRFKQWDKDNEIILEYNPDYYEGRPYLDRIMVKTYPASRDVWTALMRGEVDFTLFIEREDYEIVKNDFSFKTYTIPADYYYALVYNLNDPILSDKKIREAIAYGLNRKGLIERVGFGCGLECTGPFYPQSLGFNSDVLPFEYNPKKSQELLSEAGWKDNDNDGILEKEGEELEIRVLIDARNDIYKKIIMVIRQQLQEIGIKIKVQLYNNDSELTEKFLKENKSQAYLKFLLAGIDSDQAGAYWYSKLSKRRGILWTYGDEQIDNLFELGGVIQDKGKRAKIYQKIHKLIYEDQPACFLYFPFVFYAISNKFENIDDFFTLSMPFYTMKNWFINTRISTNKRHE